MGCSDIQSLLDSAPTSPQLRFAARKLVDVRRTGPFPSVQMGILGFEGGNHRGSACGSLYLVVKGSPV
jgi:hypothetical protein